MISQQYYSNSDNHGNYQYVSLKEVIDSVLMQSQDNDSYLRNTKRSIIINHAIQGLRELTASLGNDILAFEITIPDSLIVVFPQDYVNYVRVSVLKHDDITGSYRLYPLDINYNIHTARAYLQDNNGELTFDINGNILTDDLNNAYEKPYKKYAFRDGYQPTLNTSKLSKHGEFKADERRGRFLFSSDLQGEIVVIEYVSDGLQAELSEEKITLHKYLKRALEDYIYWQCIDYRRNVPQNEKDKARRRYKTSLHKAKLSRSNIDFHHLNRVLRTRKML